ncbi:ciliary basal body-associated, b9 protein domain-containing protein [Ditylenchus destructor]|uniref:B9 domain-containing protein 1 n=1 Tax=Ditylenchus destructor TaxID=166010 RepID=A0AAD4R970_9BILA|nr:ciliary basal body-associated, b9 protein domain-containing protein [Ditylenchus destructor]
MGSQSQRLPNPQRKQQFSVLYSGQIETAEFRSIKNIYCKYFYVYGQDWQQVSGLVEGMSSTCTRGATTGPIVLNTPLEATFTSCNPFKWPQIVISCYSMDRFGNDAVICGYGATHLPSIPGRTTRTVPIFLPQASTTMQKFIGFFTGRRAEFVDPRIVSMAEGREVTRVSTQGLIKIQLTTVFKDLKKLGYDSHAQSITRISEFPIPNFEEYMGPHDIQNLPTSSTHGQEPTQTQLIQEETTKATGRREIQTINEETDDGSEKASSD